MRKSEDDLSEVAGPVSSFQSQSAEGDIMAKQGEYRKAVEAYTRALNYRANEKNVLIARSRCHLAMGDAQSALDDAETALKEDPEFFKAKYQKAEALYARGDFEMALVFYHRGLQVRPELDEFRLGIQKAREAIDNSIGSNVNPSEYRYQVEKREEALAAAATLESGTNAQLQLQVPQQQQAQGQQDQKIGDKNVKQLLGELWVDKEYLENLLNDRDFQAHPNSAVRQHVLEGLAYLDSRTEFWRQQKPIYARRKDSGGNSSKAKAIVTA
eukprot:Partr_v1_DN28138_c0_g1_i1_m55886 putative Tetratricopeptide repeat domain 25